MRKSVMDQLEFLIIYFSLESNYAPSSAIYEGFFSDNKGKHSSK